MELTEGDNLEVSDDTPMYNPHTTPFKALKKSIKFWVGAGGYHIQTSTLNQPGPATTNYNSFYQTYIQCIYAGV